MATTPDETLPDDGSFRRGSAPRDEETSEVGVVLFRRYRLKRELGRGGMGIVMLAHDTALDILVAVKLVPDTVLKDTEAIADLRKEVLRGMALTHPNIVRTHNFERDEHTAGVIMEYVEGETLAEVKHHQPCGCFEHWEILAWIEQLCSVLDYAHTDARIIHRDLKPRNLILSKSGRLKVADFGISASLNDSRSRQSTDGVTSGTPSYMSPQQAEGKRPSPADDIHALGATIYELLTGKPPFFRGNATAIYGQILSVVPPRMAERREELEVQGKAPIPEVWEEVIASCLAKDPKARPARAGDVIARLRQAKEPVVAQTLAMEPSTQYWAETATAVMGPGVVMPGAGPANTPTPAPAAPHLDENVQFTVFRQPSIEPMKWHPLAAFAHLSEKPPGAPADEPDPVEEVQRQARAVLGKAFEDAVELVQDSRMAVPREGEITFLPEVENVIFNPRQSTFLWTESVHRSEFRMRAAAGTEGRTLRGRLTVFLGQIILADIALTFRVDARIAARAEGLQPESARPYRKIFASYSHRDAVVVAQFERYATSLGDRYLRDAIHLRAGEVWSDQLREMIREADVFQLFWSSNSMRSRHCRAEWEYALSLAKPNFVRPTYWESPLPELPEEGLPGENLGRLHFQQIGFSGRPVDEEEVAAPVVSAPILPPSAPARPSRGFTTRMVAPSTPPPPASRPSVPAVEEIAMPPASVPPEMPNWATAPAKSGSNLQPLAIVGMSVILLGLGAAFLVEGNHARKPEVTFSAPPVTPVLISSPTPALTPAPSPIAPAATPTPTPPSPSPATPSPTPVPATPAPPSTPVSENPASSLKAAIQSVIAGYTKSLSSDHPPDVAQFLADRIDYEKLGSVPRSSVVRDVDYDARNWPDRKYAIENIQSIRTHGIDRAEAIYIANYEVRNSKGVSYGRMEMTVHFDTSDPAKPLLTSVKSRVLNARKNQKPDKKP